MSAIELSAKRLLGDGCLISWGAQQIKEDLSKRLVSYTGEEACKAVLAVVQNMAKGGFSPSSQS